MLTTIPGVSNIAFASSGYGFYFGVSHFLDPANNVITLMYAGIDQSTGDINWATLVPGTANLAIESIT